MKFGFLLKRNQNVSVVNQKYVNINFQENTKPSFSSSKNCTTRMAYVEGIMDILSNISTNIQQILYTKTSLVQIWSFLAIL